MFSHRGLFLAVVIPLASIALADVLVQQLPNQESTQTTHLSGVQTVYPYESYQANAPSHVVSYPHRPPYHQYHYLPRHHVHYARIGGHGYMRPSVYVGYPQPLAVHTRSKRSRRSDPTRTEFGKSEIPAHDNDVATKSPLTDAKQPTTVDSLLPEHEPTDTNDKRVQNRQIGDYVTRSPLFGLYPKNMHLGSSSDNPNEWQHMIRQSNSNQPSTEQDEMSCGDSRLISNRPYGRFDPSSQESDDDDYYRSKYRDASNNVEKAAKWYEAFHTSLLNNARNIMPGVFGIYVRDPPRKTAYTCGHCGRAAHQELEKKPLQEITNMNMISMAKPSQDKTLHIPFYPENTPKAHQYARTSDTAVATTSVQPQEPFVTYVQNGYRNNEELSGTDEIVSAPHFDRTGRPSPNYSYYSYNHPNHYSNHDSDNADFYINFNTRNSNSADNSIKPPIKVPDSVYSTNIISARRSASAGPPEWFWDWAATGFDPDKLPVQPKESEARVYPGVQTSNPPYETPSSPVYYYY